MFDYQEMQDIASDLLTEFDQSRGTGAVTDGLWYVAVTPGSGPVDEPGPSLLSFHKLDGAARGVSQEYLKDASILASDYQATVAIDASRPALKGNGFIDLDGVRNKIVRIDNIPPSGIPVAQRVFFGKR